MLMLLDEVTLKICVRRLTVSCRSSVRIGQTVMSCPASAAQKQKTYNKAEELPSTDDLVKLKKFTEQKLADLSKQLKNEATYKVWRSLAETVLAQLVVFEPAKMLLSHYVERPDWKNKSNSELLNNLKPVEKVFMKCMVCMDLVQVPAMLNR